MPQIPNLNFDPAVSRQQEGISQLLTAQAHCTTQTGTTDDAELLDYSISVTVYVGMRQDGALLPGQVVLREGALAMLRQHRLRLQACQLSSLP